MKLKSSTLDDLEGHWQPVRSAILATAGLLVYSFRSSSVNRGHHDKLTARLRMWLAGKLCATAVQRKRLYAYV